MPRSRIPVFEKRLSQLCDEAGLPPYDEYKYDVLQDAAVFLWHDPEFCLGVSLATASPFAMKAHHLRDAFERKHGPLKAA